MNPLEIKIGTAYSNGDFGKNWNVWQVVDIYKNTEAQLIVRYRVMAGKKRRKTFSCTMEEFVEKIRYEVELNDSSWLKVE